MTRSSDSGSADVWGEESDNADVGAAELAREQQARNKHHYNTGYREGLEVGKERALQPGFNIGYKEGAAAGFEWGSIRATAKTLEILCGQVPGTSNIQEQVSKLCSRVHAVPAREAMLGALHQRLTSPLSLQQGQDAAGSNVELEQAFSRLCVKQQEQQASAASSSEGSALAPAKLPNMEDVAKHVVEELSSLGFKPPCLDDRSHVENLRHGVPGGPS